MTENSEKAKMLAGELYRAVDPELGAMHRRCVDVLREFNATTETEADRRVDLLRSLLGGVGSSPQITPTFYCDYGSNIYAGDNLYLNFGCVILDCNTVHLGHNLQCGPYVQIYTATHPTDPIVRSSGLEYALPVRIGDNVWIGGGAIVCSGVTIGDNTTIEAGSVVTRDIPANVIAVGNPCRVLRSLDSQSDQSSC